MDTIFRTKNESKESSEPVKETKVTDTSIGSVDDNIEVPYSDYKKMKSKPYTVDFFNLGQYWNDPSGGYQEEIEVIEDYFNSKIDSGKIANTVDAVKYELKEIERINNLTHESRIPVKIGVIKEYIKFLRHVDSINRKVTRYG